MKSLQHSAANRAALLVLAVALTIPAACTLPDDDGASLVIALPAQRQLALLTPAQQALVSASVEMPALSIGGPLSIDWTSDPVTISGRFEVCVGRRLFDPACELPSSTEVHLRVSARAAADVDDTFLIAAHSGVLDLGDPASTDVVSFDIGPADFLTCARNTPPDDPSFWEGGSKVRCEPRFDLNQNGIANIDDFAHGIDPSQPPSFVDTVPRDMQFPSGIELGSFAQEAIVVENLSSNPVELTARVVGAPGTSLSRYEGEPHEDDTPRLIRLGTLEAFDQTVLAVSFAPVNPFFTTGAVYIEAKDLVTEVPQSAVIKVIGNADGQLQTPPAGYQPATSLADGAKPGGYDGPSPPFPLDRLFSGLELTGVSAGTLVANDDEESEGGLPYQQAALTATFARDASDDVGEAAPINASAVFTVALPPRYTLSATLSGLARESIVGLATVALDDDDTLHPALTYNRRSQGARGSPAAIELYNDSASYQLLLVVLSRSEDDDGRGAGRLPVPFKLSVQISKAPVIQLVSPSGGPLEGGVPVTICGRGFHPGATVLMAGATAIDCAFSESLEACLGASASTDGFSCVTPTGSLEHGKNPATVVVLNPAPESGGDGQAATLPNGYDYEPPAPRLFQLVPDFGAIYPADEMAEITLHGSFFSSRVAPPQVFFGGAPAQSVALIDSTRLVVVPPVLPEGTVGVSARNVLALSPNGEAELVSLFSDQVTFRYHERTGVAPTLSPLDPTGQASLFPSPHPESPAPRVSIDGVALASDGSGGIRLDGTGFVETPRVFFGEQEGSVFWVSATELRVGVPPVPFPLGGAVRIRILNPDGQVAQLESAVAYFTPAPVITDVSPSQVQFEGSSFVAVHGTGFRAGPEVRLLHRDSSRVIIGQNVTLTTTTPKAVLFSAGSLTAADVGDYDVEIRNRAIFSDPLVEGNNLAATWPGPDETPFRIVAESALPPKIVNVTPQSVAVGSSTVISVDGDDFDDDISGGLSVLVGTHVATDVTSDGSVVTFRLPASLVDAGVWTLRVINADGQGDSATLSTYHPVAPPPVIYDVTPSAGGPGTAVIVGGDQLASADGPMRVFLGSVELGSEHDLSVSPNEITFTVPEILGAGDSTLLFLRVTDPFGQSVTAPFQYDVDLAESALNQPPSVAAADRAVTAGDDVSVLAIASDPDGTIVRVAWSQVSGPPVTLAGADQLQVVFTAPVVGTPESMVLEVEVEDDDGALDWDAVRIDVLPVTNTNRPPTVFAGVDQSVSSLESVTLTGTFADGDGTVDTLQWTQVAGTEVSLDTPQLDTVGFTAPTVACAERLVFQLTVTDNDGASRSDRVSVIVEPDPVEIAAESAAFDFENDDGGFLTTSSLWQWGVPGTGPATAYSGGRVWGTALSGNYVANDTAFLCLPAIERPLATGRVTFSFRASNYVASGDGLTLEGLDPEAGWVPLVDVLPATTVVVAGRPAWGSTPATQTWWLHTADVPSWLGASIRLRFVFHSDGTWLERGAYIDDVRLDDEGTDPDGDGLSGVRDELALYGTDPFVSDVDGDGFLDGAELSGGFDPTNPASHSDQTTWSAGHVESFESGAAGLRGVGGFQFGAPASGPVRAHSGSSAWATILGGNYGQHKRMYLYLPPVDLTGVDDGLLYARIWVGAQSGDGLVVEGQDEDGTWRAAASLFTPYDAQDAIGQAAWRYQRYLNNYIPVAVDLSPFADRIVALRFAFRTDGAWEAPGAYIDDVAVMSNAVDSDGDGFAGILAELAAGTDPFVADSDGDGHDDGEELSAGTGPTNPADYPGVPMLAVGEVLDFDDGPGGFVTDTTLWQHGGVGNGPGSGYLGTSAWATNLTGNYPGNHRDYLYFPPIDLSAASDPMLVMRLWMGGQSGDAVSVERLVAGSGWQAVTPTVPAYDATDGAGKPGWRNQTPYDGQYTLALLSLAVDVGDVLLLRMAFRTDGAWEAAGAYIDEVGVVEEASDPDGDGVAGVYGEVLSFGTDPLDADSDDDGHNDGAERTAGTNGNNPADYPGVVMLAPGDVLDFDDGPSGLVASGALWKHGGVGNGPGYGYNGASAWATNLTGNYGQNRREYLYLPPIDLTAAIDPTFVMRLWMNGQSGDGVSVERLVDGSGWQTVTPYSPAYDSVDGLGRPAWRVQMPATGYALALLSLDAEIGEVALLRMAFRSDGAWEAAGAYIDEVGVLEEGVDPDGDGLLGVNDELTTYGTDPLVADTDGDGVNDGDEVTAMTDPLDELSF